MISEIDMFATSSICHLFHSNGYLAFIVAFLIVREPETCDFVIGARSLQTLGYDQGERNTILPYARAVDWVLSRIAKACECDCSSLGGVCGIAAGAAEGTIYAGGNLCYTGNIVARFAATGLVTCYASADYVKSTVKRLLMK